MNTENTPDILKTPQPVANLEDLEDIKLIQQRADGPFVEVKLADL